MQLSISTIQLFFFAVIFVSALVILLYNYGPGIMEELKSNNSSVSSEDIKTKVDNYFTNKGYLVWDIKQEEKTKRWNVSLVKNKKIIEAKGYSIPEIERYAESIV
jgi:hypothetical protein